MAFALCSNAQRASGRRCHRCRMHQLLLQLYYYTTHPTPPYTVIVTLIKHIRYSPGERWQRGGGWIESRAKALPSSVRYYVDLLTRAAVSGRPSAKGLQIQSTSGVIFVCCFCSMLHNTCIYSRYTMCFGVGVYMLCLRVISLTE